MFGFDFRKAENSGSLAMDEDFYMEEETLASPPRHNSPQNEETTRLLGSHQTIDALEYFNILHHYFD